MGTKAAGINLLVLTEQFLQADGKYFRQQLCEEGSQINYKVKCEEDLGARKVRNT